MNGTSWKFYTSNPEAWDAMIDACNNAQSTIDFEIFIFTPDEVGRRFIDACTEAAKRGVKVRFLWDAAGSFTFFSTNIISELKRRGIELIFFKTLLPSIFTIHDYRSWYFRNHRRTLVIDGKIGFTGSTSLEKRMEKWRDTSVRIEGPAVTDMQVEFSRMWLRAQGKRLSRIPSKTDYEFEYVTNNPIPGRRFLYNRIVEAIRSAERTLYITVPYFVPNHRLSRVIRLAAKRGVDVRLLLPAASDFPTVDLGARTYFHQLLSSGVRIFLYRGMMHAKTIVVDEGWSTVGTLNLDHISLLHNFEANLVSTNLQFARDLLDQFEKDLQNCSEVTLEAWNRRFFVEKIATFFVRFFRSFL